MVEGYIKHLLSTQAWDEAASLSHRLLKDDAKMWERWAYMFAQARQLPKLARVLPIGARLGGSPAATSLRMLRRAAGTCPACAVPSNWKAHLLAVALR